MLPKGSSGACSRRRRAVRELMRFLIIVTISCEKEALVTEQKVARLALDGASNILPERACEVDVRRHVQVVSEGRCIVPRSLFFVDRRCPEGRPFAFLNGRVVATGIKPESVHALCGLRNGDEWLRVNKVRVDAPEAFLAAYRGLASAPALTIEVGRGGRALVLRIDFKDDPVR